MMLEDSQQFISKLRENLYKFFKIYNQYCDESKSLYEKFKLLEDIACLSWGIANELWNKILPLEEDTLAKNTAEQILPPISSEEILKDV